jgi:hypothetical protein
MPVRGIFKLTPHNRNGFEIKAATAYDKLEILSNNTFRLQYAEGMGVKPQVFRRCVELGRRVRVKTISRPTTPFLIDELADLLEGELT